MRKLGSIIAAVVVLFGAQAADARKAHAGVARVMVESGPAKRARDWVPEGKPQLGDSLLVPAGKRMEVLSKLEAGSVRVEPGGELSGPASIEMNGSLDLEGSSAWTGVLESYGVNHLATHGNYLSNIEQEEGHIELAGPLHVGMFQWKGTVVTAGFPLTVDGRLYRLEGSFTNYATSTVTAGEYRAYPLKVTPDSRDTLVEAMQASIVVNGTTAGIGAFEGAGACYGGLTLEAPVSARTLFSYLIEGRWTDNTPALTVERGSTVTIEGDELAGEVVFGPAARTVQSSEPGRPYTFQIPYDLEATTTATVSDMHVTGATLTLHGATDGGGDEGVVFD